MVDYTVPDVIHDMVDLYIKHKTPFVMGTTGGNRQQILADVQAADLYAVIAPQMGKQVRKFADHTHAEAQSPHLTKQ
jgi:4-hydroxy-tetrahydrodipicolinate reductase